jgi:GDP-4-dehydro-6-deoxy-D-mannose reductase
MRVLVTGIGGFAGPTAGAALRRAGHEVLGLVRRRVENPRLDALGLPGDAIHVGDVTDAEVVARLVTASSPDAVVHLAAISFVPAAERDPLAAYHVNVGGTLAVLAAVRAHAPRARVLVVTSSDLYGASETTALDEDAPMRPRTIYGASKAAADVAAGQWARAYGLHVVRARPFNHTGPGQAPEFVCSALTRQMAAIELGLQPPVLQVGNTDPVRDLSDVRDVAAGYVALLERGTPGAAYNLCAGAGVSIAEVVAIVRSLGRVPVQVRTDPALQRRVEVPRVVGSHEAATRDTSWRPSIPLADTLGALLDDWRERLARA